MKQNNASSLRDFLERMSTEQLERLLNEELHRENTDSNSVQLILEILRERDQKEIPQITPQIQAAWDEYQREISLLDHAEERNSRIRSFGLRAAATAAVLILLFSVIPQQVRAQTFWEKLTRFTESIFEYFTPSDNQGQVEEYAYSTENPGLDPVYDAVLELGITEPVVPMWLPDGFAIMELKTQNTPSRSRVYSWFQNQESHITLSFAKYVDGISQKFIKDESIVETLEIEGIVHTIIKNDDCWTAVWTKDKIECSIYVDCQEDVLYRILRSIYGMEDT